MNKNTLKLFALAIVLNVFFLSGNAYAFVDDHQITITSAADVTSKRQALIDFIWGGPGFPAGKLPTSVTLNVPSPVQGLNNLLRVDQLLINMEAKQQGLAYHFIPQRQNNRLVIVHHGHACSFDDDSSSADIEFGMQRTINGLLTDGYSVLAVYMPHNRPGDCGGTAIHDAMFTGVQYRPRFGSPMKYFLEPVAVSLNYLKTRSAADGFPVYQDFSMVGLSGGGWTTTVYAAIDPTIKFSIPVAGTMPLYNRAGGSNGDTEQYLDAFYQIAGYPDLYVLGSYGTGRKQVWLLNRRDNCCFGDNPALYQDPQGRTWEQVVRDYEYQVRMTLYNLGAAGFFRLEIDEAAPSHMISWNAVVNQILSELNGGRRYVGASSSSHAFVRGLNGQLWHYGPGGWENTGCPMVGVAAALEGVVNSLDVFYRDGGNRLMHAFPKGLGWTCQPISGGSISDPAVVSSEANSYDIVSFGGDYRLYHWHGTSGGIGPYESVNYGVRGLGTPSLVARGPNQLDIFFRGFDRGLYHISSSGGAVPWPVEAVGGVMLDFPSAISVSGGSLRAYLRGQSSQLWEAAQVNAGAWQWSSVSAQSGGQLIAGSPSASVQGSTVKVHARQPANNLSSFMLNGAWNYANNGGDITGSPTSTPGGAWVRWQDASLHFHDGTNWFALGGLFD